MAPLSSLDEQIKLESDLDETSFHSYEAQNQRQDIFSKPHCNHNKTTRFNKVAVIREIMHINQYSDEEIINCWYTEEESGIMAEIAQVCAQRLDYCHEANIPTRDDDAFCWRGLECLAQKGLLLRRTNRDLGLDIVLGEQQLQLEEGTSDPHGIAILYRTASSDASAQAHAVGLRDRIDVLQ